MTRSAPNWTVSPISSSKLMMRPVILSRPEKLAFLLMIFCAGGSVTTSSPGCSVGGDCGTPLGWRCPGGTRRIGAGGATATPWLAAAAPRRRRRILRNDGGAGRRRQRLRLHRARRRHALPRRQDDWASATAGPAAVPARPLRRRAAADCRGECCRADAAPDRKRYCRSARAPAAQARSSMAASKRRKTSQGNGSKHLARL